MLSSFAVGPAALFGLALSTAPVGQPIDSGTEVEAVRQITFGLQPLFLNILRKARSPYRAVHLGFTYHLPDSDTSQVGEARSGSSVLTCHSRQQPSVVVGISDHNTVV